MNRHFLENNYFYGGFNYHVNDNESDYGEDRLPMDSDFEDEYDVNLEFEVSDSEEEDSEFGSREISFQIINDESDEFDNILHIPSNPPSPVFFEEVDINMPQEAESLELPDDIPLNNYNVELEEEEVDDEVDDIEADGYDVDAGVYDVFQQVPIPQYDAEH